MGGGVGEGGGGYARCARYARATYMRRHYSYPLCDARYEGPARSGAMRASPLIPPKGSPPLSDAYQSIKGFAAERPPHYRVAAAGFAAEFKYKSYTTHNFSPLASAAAVRRIVLGTSPLCNAGVRLRVSRIYIPVRDAAPHHPSLQ